MCVTVPDLVDLVLEAQDFGEGVQDVDGESFISLRLPEDVLCHHDEGILLWGGREGSEGGGVTEDESLSADSLPGASANWELNDTFSS